MLVLLFSGGSIYAQTYGNVAEIIDAYLGAATLQNYSERSEQFRELFLPEGVVGSHSGQASAAPIMGSWSDFVTNSQPFLERFQLGFDEYERELDFYADMASAHLLLEQVVVDRTTGKTYAQMMWMQMELVYQDDRWYISSLFWNTSLQSQDIFEALKQDTLWNRIGP